MNIEAITLKLLLHETDKEKALEIYSELKSDYFSTSFKPILRTVKEFYDKNGHIPSASELKVFRSRNNQTLSAIMAVELVDSADVDVHIAVEELANQHAQNTTLDLVDDLLTEISLLSRHELLDKLALIPIKLEETLSSSEVVFSARDIQLFTRPDKLDKIRMKSGISDQWDNEAGGYFRQELVLLGGKRGSGKSIFCANLIAQQHKQGNVSIFATIEMTAKECFDRIMCILSGVSFSDLRQGTLDKTQTKELAYVMANLFEGGDVVFEKHFSTTAPTDVFAFQDELQTTCTEKDEGRIIILDDRDLSIATLDVKLSTYKARYGDKLTLCVVDYINQVILEPGADPYDWKTQTLLGKMLKNLARKNDVALISPYQMDDSGATRFAKGILDAADLAQLIKVNEDDNSYLALETTKARSTRDDGVYRIRINWECLQIDPTELSAEDIDGSVDDTKNVASPMEEGMI